MPLTTIFKAYDVRGKVGSELTPQIANKIGRAFADWLPQQGVVAVGRDMRPDSAELAAALVEGLRMQGREVWDIDEVTSDMIYFAVGHYKLAGGVMITASHNPGEYNGIKFCREEAKPVGEETGLFEVRDKAEADNFSAALRPGKVIQKKDVIKDWIIHVLSFIDTTKLKPLHLAVDAGNGMAGKVFPKLETCVPFKVEELYFELDGTFPNHIANPLEPKNLLDLQAAIKEHSCDAGVAFDGDGDRAVLVDETGTILSGGVMSAMLAEYFLQKYPGANIVYDARNSRTVPEVIAELGGNPVRERVGHSFLKQAMRKADAPFGGEFSGHFYFRDNWYADSGLIGAVIGLYLLCLSGKKLSEIRKKYERYAAIPETNFEIKDKTTVIEQISNVFADYEQDRLDGLTVNLPGGWFNVRPSNTEPLLRLNAEAGSQVELDQLIDRIKKLIG